MLMPKAVNMYRTWKDNMIKYISGDILQSTDEYIAEIDKAILEDYENGGTTNEYVRWYLDEWDAIDDLLPNVDSTKTKEEQFLFLLI